MLTLEQADDYLSKAEEEICLCKTEVELVQIRAKFLGKNSQLQQAISAIASLSIEKKKAHGKVWHTLFVGLERSCKQHQEKLKQAALDASLASEALDISLPVDYASGGLHPVTKTRRRIEDIFAASGFKIATGPEIESDYYNFTALNIPENHSARAAHDTFYFNSEMLLRTHTSPVQIHTLEAQKPPVQIICPGRVYRFDSDATHTPMFHQIEGLVVDKAGKVSFAHLKGLLTDFLHAFFAQDFPVRFRPSYFPFTEPSVEVDIGCIFCAQEGCRVCSNSGWIEVLGAGMVHPNVLEGVGLNADEYQGLAFGVGVERLCMLYYGIDDLRILFENNLQFLKQFEAS